MVHHSILDWIILQTKHRVIRGLDLDPSLIFFSKCLPRITWAFGWAFRQEFNWKMLDLHLAGIHISLVNYSHFLKPSVFLKERHKHCFTWKKLGKLQKIEALCRWRTIHMWLILTDYTRRPLKVFLGRKERMLITRNYISVDSNPQ